MLKVRIILENELAEEISQKSYPLEGSMENFDLALALVTQYFNENQG